MIIDLKLAFLASVLNLDCSLLEGVKLITSNVQIASCWNIIKRNSWRVEFSSMTFKTFLSTQQQQNQKWLSSLHLFIFNVVIQENEF